MPNWAFGIVEVSGTKTEIESFIGRFISDDDPPTTIPSSYGPMTRCLGTMNYR